MNTLRISLLSISLISLMLCRPSFAATIHILIDQTTIQAGIETAAYGDTILVSPGTYVERLDFGGKSICLMSQSGAENTIIMTPVSGEEIRLEFNTGIDSLTLQELRDLPVCGDPTATTIPIIDLGYGNDSSTVINGFTINGQLVAQGIYGRFSDIEIRNCIFESCYTNEHGGAVYLDGGAPRIHDNLIRNCEAYLLGGGFYFRPRLDQGTAQISGNKFFGCYAIAGGAMMLELGNDVEVSRNIIYDNHNHIHAVYKSTMFLAEVNDAVVVNNTICHNSSGLQVVTASNVEIMNNIISHNLGGALYLQDDVGPCSNVTIDYNDVWGNGQDYLYLAEPGEHDISADPLFDENHPGEFYLTGLSPCRDTGNPNPAYNDPDGTRNDMGAVPYTGPHDPHTPITLLVPSGYGTIQLAIDASGNGDTILVAPGTYAENISFEGKSIRLVSESGPEVTVIQSPPGDTEPRPDFLHHVDSLNGGPPLPGEKGNYFLPVVAIGSGSDSSTVLSGFTIDAKGGGQCIICIGSSPEISNCIIQNAVGYYDGGGIYASNASPLIKDNIIRWNYASVTGGGIFAIDAPNGDTLVITGNTIYENDATNGPGIAVLDCADAVVEKNMVYGNDAFWGSIAKGAVYIKSSSYARIINNTVHANILGITTVYQSNAYIYNNIVFNNPTGGIEYYSGGTNYNDYNLVWYNGGRDYLLEATQGEHDILADPVFEFGQLMGGYHLAAGSPCIDAGNPDPAYNDPDGSRNDIGAVPFTPVDPYKPTSRYVPSQFSTIQEAIDAAWHGDTIFAAAGLYREHVDFKGKSISLISESGAGQTTIIAPSVTADTIPLAGPGWSLVAANNRLSTLPEKMQDKEPVDDRWYEWLFEQPTVYAGFGCDSTTVVAGFTIDGNSRVQPFFGMGADPVIRDCIIQNGYSDDNGGGLYFIWSSPEVTGNVIRDNFAVEGSTIETFLRYGTKTTRFSDNVVYRNFARYAPGLTLAEGADAIVERNIFYANIAHDEDWDLRGAVYLFFADNVRISNNTLDGNTQGITTYTSNGVDILNNIISNSLYAGLEIQDDTKNGKGINSDYNDFWNNPAGDFLVWAVAGPNDIFADPLFEPGYAGQYYLTDASPCIDAGHPATEYNDPDGSRNDIGAVPYEPVTPYEPKTILVPADFGTIQGAIEAAEDGDTILVSQGIYQEYVCFLSKSIVLVSESGAEGTIIKAPDVGEKADFAYLDEIDHAFNLLGGPKDASFGPPLVYPPAITIVPGGSGTPILSGFTIDGNRHSAQGIMCLGVNAVISDCIVEYCRCFWDGGGILIHYCAPLVKNNIVRHNLAPMSGGGIFVRLGTGVGTARIIENELYDNHSYSGSGLCIIEGDNALIKGNIIHGNLGLERTFQAAVYCYGDNLQIINNTIFGNTSGIMLMSVNKADIQNNIICHNFIRGLTLDDEFGPFSEVTFDYNNIFFNHEDDYGYHANAGPNDISVNPLFEPTHSGKFCLMPGSPCIDAGNPDTAYNDPDGSRNDIGAVPYYNYQPTPPVTRYVPLDHATIQRAIDASSYGDSIIVGSGEYEDWVSFCGKSTTLVSEFGAENTIIRMPDVQGFLNQDKTPFMAGGELSETGSRENPRDTGWFFDLDVIHGAVVFSPGSDSTTVIEGFTIDGNMENRGIFCAGSDPNIRECIVENGLSSYMTYGGGGIFVRNGLPVISDNIIRDNYAPETGLGGGIYYWFSIRNSGKDALEEGVGVVRITDNWIYNNRARHTPAVHIRGDFMEADSVFFERNVVAANTNFNWSTNWPDAISIDFTAYLKVVNNTIVDNIKGIRIAASRGEFIYNNIICNNYEGGIIFDVFIVESELDYNNVWGNGIYNYDFAYGSAVGDNSLSTDPLFDPRIPGGYFLSENSPCVDSGHPDPVYNDPDGSRNDIGALPYTPAEPHDPVILHVPSEYGTIQAAVDASWYGDTILVAPGIYPEQLSLDGKSVKLISEAGAEVTTITVPDDWLASFSGPQTGGLDTPCDIGDLSREEWGPFGPVPEVIHLDSRCDTSALISGFTIDGGWLPGDDLNNSMRGIHAVGSDAEISDCIIENCNARVHGGSEQFWYCYTGAGAGIYVEGGAPLVKDNVIRNNSGGGGISLDLGYGCGIVQISGNKIYNNESYYGYGILCRYGAGALIERNIIYGNVGGVGYYDMDCCVGLWVDSVRFINNTVVGNKDGLLIRSGSHIDIRNNIIIDNSVYGLMVREDDGPATDITIDYNALFGNDSDYVELAVQGDHDVFVDPIFAPDRPFEFFLSPMSPCIDAGDPDPQYDDSDGSINDIGAVPAVVTPTSRYVPAEYATIQDAINMSYARDTVVVWPGSYEEFLDFKGKSITLISQGGAEVTTIGPPRGSANSRRQEAMITANSNRSTPGIFDITIDGGGQVQGISCIGADATVSGCIIENCFYYGEGAALGIHSAVPALKDNIVRNNFGASLGAGIFVSLPCDDSNTAVISGNTIYGNSSWSNAGIAVDIGTGGAVIERNIIYDNTIEAASVNQGVIYLGTDNINVINNTLDNNTLGVVIAPNVLYADIRNNIITNNSSGGLLVRESSARKIGPVSDYNDIWNNGGMDYIGPISPGANDISLDPQFRQNLPHSYLLSEASPCIDAGDPDPLYNDPDSSRCDMGARPYTPGQCGDANGDDQTNVGDIVFIINYVFKNGPAPDPINMADVNNDGEVNVADAVYLINFVFKNGPTPDCPQGGEGRQGVARKGSDKTDPF